jgi:hypothetical protein
MQGYMKWQQCPDILSINITLLHTFSTNSSTPPISSRHNMLSSEASKESIQETNPFYDDDSDDDW